MDDAGNFRYDQRGGSFMNCQSSRKYERSQLQRVGDTETASVAAYKEASPSMGNPCSAANMADHLLVDDWNPFAGVPEHVGFTGSTASSYGVGTERNQRVSSSCGCLIDHIQSCLRFSGGNISEILSTFPFSEGLQIADALDPTDLQTRNDHGVEKDDKGKKRKIQEVGASDSQSKVHSTTQIAEDEHKKDVPSGSIKSAGKDANKLKREQKGGAKSHKSASKQAKEHYSNGDASKDDYAHIRAKRGQATNSHSLAERLRREKISERMRFLQDLVPGCSKITGKAVMLDEIINYVHSLQRQVEFLSMKLSTVTPELNYDIEQILSKDVLLPQAGGLGFVPGFSTSYHQFQQPIQQGLTQLEVEKNPTPGEALKHSLPQMSNGWDEDLRNLMQMGFIPSAQLDTASQQPVYIMYGMEGPNPKRADPLFRVRPPL
ncbi:hypothetical protein Taro_002788 [Colocasia esculenta]|uniref:BHLH domain-containing protein n=1 Tax=Colocasia esculenta TaxID=4460 RepID=A0A843TK64_COLES|nr:hypothetical protein [Colocasia esculenta]